MLTPVASATPVVFLLDVDNTLLDNDGIRSDLDTRLLRDIGADGQALYWKTLEALRIELGYVDYLGTLQRCRIGGEFDQHLARVADFLIDYPFPERVYPGAHAAIAELDRLGLSVVLSDGDVVFQPRKVHRSGLWNAVGGRVLIYVHKEMEISDITARYPAAHYVLVDDKLALLTAIKKQLGNRLTTVFPRQGHYAHDPKILGENPPADITIDKIGDLAQRDIQARLAECIRRSQMEKA